MPESKTTIWEPSRASTSQEIVLTTSAGIFESSTQNNHPEDALIRSVRTDPSDDAEMVQSDRKRAVRSGKAEESMGKSPTIASNADGSVGEE